MSDKATDWKHLARHAPTGREALWRIDNETMRNGFEWRVTVSLQARDADGVPLGALTRHMDWGNNTGIDAEFNDDGTEVLFHDKSTHELRETLTLAPAAAPDGK